MKPYEELEPVLGERSELSEKSRKLTERTYRHLPGQAMKACCKTCVYWGERLEWFDLKDGVDTRTCGHVMVCQPSYGTRGNRRMTPSGVYTMDEGGCTGDLWTGPEFGCIHFEPKA